MPTLQPLTPEDLYAFRFAADPRISPDGERVAFAVRTIDREANAYRSAIWIVPFDGSRPAERVTFGPGEDSSPRWSPDGRWLAFLSDRQPPPKDGERKKGAKQVYVMPVAGGEARALTELSEDCSDLAWSPRGDALVFVMRDAREGEKKDEIKVYDRVRYKSDEAGLFDGRRRHIWLACLDATPPRQLTAGDWDDLQPSVSPDGTRVAFVSNRTEERDRNTVNDIWVAPLGAGEPSRITDGRGSYGNPSWSPDGASIAAYGVPVAVGSQARNVHLFVFAADGAAAGRDLLHDWDRTVGSVVMSDMRGQIQTVPPVWRDERDRLHFVGSDQGTANIYSCAEGGGDVRAVTIGAHQIVAASFDARVKRYAAILATATDPGNVVAGEVGGEMRGLTDLNGELLSGRFLAEPERVELGGADGWRIEGWLLRPRGFDAARKWPLVLEVHGGPHSAYGHSFFHEFQVLAGCGYGVLYLNPRGSHAYGDAFVRACVGDWGGKDYQDLMAGVDHVVSQGWVDQARLYLTGGSYGGFMTNWIVGHTDRFRAAATQRSISNNVSAFGVSDIGWHFWQDEMGDATPWRDGHKLVERSPLTYVTRINTPLLILHAERDLRCPIEQAEQLFVALRVLDKEAVFVRFPEDNHDLTRGGKPHNRVEHCRRIADWFDAHL